MTEESTTEEVTTESTSPANSKDYADQYDNGSLDRTEAVQVAPESKTESLLDMGTKPSEETTEIKDGDPKWFYSENVPGKGDKPEYFIDSKFKSLDEQAKGYNELRKKLGGFTGAPDEYKVELIEDVAKHIDIDDDSTLMTSFKDYAKEKNMSQEAFNDLVNLYTYQLVQGEQDLMSEIQNDLKKEFESLGESGGKMIDDVKGWMKANIPEDLTEPLVELTKTAKGLKALHMLSQRNNYHAITTESETSIMSDPEHIQQRQLNAMKDPRWLKDVKYTEYVEGLHK